MNEIAAVSDVFEAIYRSDQWTNGSGPGSHPEATIEYRAFLSRFIEANDVTTVTDFGCGDWQSSRLMDWSKVRYFGIDIAPSVIERNTRLYGAGAVQFRIFQSTNDLPGGDLCICKDVLQHLPNAVVRDYLKAITSRYRFCLITNDSEPEDVVNIDIHPGGWRPLRLERAPFLARGAIVLPYVVQRKNQFWKKNVFLICGR